MPKETSYFARLPKLKEQIDATNTYAIEIYNEIDTFIRNGYWYTSKAKKKTSRHILSIYDLTDTETVRYLQRYYGETITESTVRSEKRLLNIRLSTLIGSYDEIETLLINNDIEQLRKLHNRLVLLDKEELFLFDFIGESLWEFIRSIYMEKKPKTPIEYNVFDCMKEFQFLLTHSKDTVKQQITELDINKLVYVCDTIDSPLFDKGGINTEKQYVLERLSQLVHNDIELTLDLPTDISLWSTQDNVRNTQAIERAVVAENALTDLQNTIIQKEQEKEKVEIAPKIKVLKTLWDKVVQKSENYIEEQGFQDKDSLFKQFKDSMRIRQLSLYPLLFANGLDTVLSLEIVEKLTDLDAFVIVYLCEKDTEGSLSKPNAVLINALTDYITTNSDMLNALMQDIQRRLKDNEPPTITNDTDNDTTP